VESTANASAVAVEQRLNGLTALVQSYANRPTLITAMGSGRSPEVDRSLVDFHLGQLHDSTPGARRRSWAGPGGHHLPDR